MLIAQTEVGDVKYRIFQQDEINVSQGYCDVGSVSYPWLFSGGYPYS
jgi:hypothetical protein